MDYVTKDLNSRFNLSHTDRSLSMLLFDTNTQNLMKPEVKYFHRNYHEIDKLRFARKMGYNENILNVYKKKLSDIDWII